MLVTACSDNDREGVSCCLSRCDAVESFTQLLSPRRNLLPPYSQDLEEGKFGGADLNGNFIFIYHCTWQLISEDADICVYITLIFFIYLE